MLIYEFINFTDLIGVETIHPDDDADMEEKEQKEQMVEKKEKDADEKEGGKIVYLSKIGLSKLPKQLSWHRVYFRIFTG